MFARSSPGRLIRQLEALITQQAAAASETVEAPAAAVSEGAAAPPAAGPLPAQQAEQLEQALSSGMNFLTGLFKIATGTDITLKDQKIEVDKATGEVTLRFKL
jgi:hypothetical protein